MARELTALRVAHENAEKRISSAEIKTEERSKEVSALQDFVGKLIPDDVVFSDGGASKESTTGSEVKKMSYAAALRGKSEEKLATNAKLVTAGTCGDIVAAELTDREKRKKNLIIFNVVEDTSDKPEDRKQADLCQVDKLLYQLHVHNDVSVQTCVRLGAIKSQEDGRVRPILIRLKSQIERDLVLANAFKCKGFYLGRQKQVGLCRDRTVSERREHVQSILNKKTKAENGSDATAPVPPAEPLPQTPSVSATTTADTNTNTTALPLLPEPVRQTPGAPAVSIERLPGTSGTMAR